MTNWGTLKRRLRPFLIAMGAIAALYAQSKLPEGHPPLERKDSVQAAAALTERLARPAGSGQSEVPRKNFIDEHIFSKMSQDSIPHAPLSSDHEFFRRIHLDLTGRIPDNEELDAFLADADPGKRDKLIDKLIGSPAYKARWTYWFGDLSKAAANRVGNDGINIYYKWVYDNIHLNRPYDEMIRDLLTTTAVSNYSVGPASYLSRWVVIGLTCEDEVHEDTADEIAINVSKHFLGLDLQCVSCHDGRNHLEKINLWLTERKRKELWQMAAFFGRMQVLRRTEIATTKDEYAIVEGGPGYDASSRSVVRVPRRGEGQIDPVFILTGERPDPNKPLRAEFARMLTSHPQFARATVNMFWKELMGAGIVDPVGEFDLNRMDPASVPEGWDVQPSHPELLDALAKDFRENGYDLQRLFKLITKSSAYQLSSSFPGEWKAGYAKYFARKFIRRLTAEELHDSIVFATRLTTPIPIRGTDLKVQYATETRSPENFKQNVPGLKDVNFFLEAFGQTNREYSERVNEGDITQAVLMMNSPFILRQVKVQPGSYVSNLLEQPSLSESDRVQKLFTRFLTRQPEQAEFATAKDLIQTYGRKGYEDLQWLLVNKVDFLFNY